MANDAMLHKTGRESPHDERQLALTARALKQLDEQAAPAQPSSKETRNNSPDHLKHMT